MQLLKGKTAIITGGTRGIGFSTADTFLKNGAKVAIFGSKSTTVEKALEKLKALNQDCQVIGFHPDLTDGQEVNKAVRKAFEAFGRLDIIINNAGISQKTSIYDYTEEEFKGIIDLNVNALFLCSQAAAKIMKEQGSGVILNTSSMVSIYGQTAGCGYPTSKFAVNGITKSLARELGKDGIRVNAVAPGVISTDMVLALPEELINQISSNIPLKRIGQPEDIANAFLFLASDLASYITGAIISVDGAAQV